MLRTTCLLTTTLLMASVHAADPPSSSFDMAEVCFQAASESPDLLIDEKIVGYCTTALGEATTAERSASVLNNRAILRIRQNNRTAARADLAEAVRLHPGSLDARLTLGYLDWLEGNLVAAEKAYSDALAVAPLPLAALNRSLVRRQRGDIVGAMRDALLAAGHSPEDIDQLMPETPLAAAPAPESGTPD